MSKRHLSEEDIKARYITPAITKAGWDIKKASQIRICIYIWKNNSSREYYC